MQTAAISYRVIDFLKQHPPFSSIEESDLLALVSRGRVKFHEKDEFLCWQKAAYAPFVLVIQQGSVSLWEEANGQELLRDIRGPGDMIGIERFLASQAYPYSAKANGDVVVYALHAADFEPLLAKYPQAERYVQSHAAAGAVYRDSARQGVHETFVVELARHPEPLTCPAEATIADAACILHSANAGAVGVIKEHVLQGAVTAADILGWVAQRGAITDPVTKIMSAVPPIVAPQTTVSDCVLAMSRAATPVVALTADGTPQGGLLRLVCAGDLQPVFGDHPLGILQEIDQASDLEVVRLLHLRARSFLIQQLSTPSAVDWLSVFADAVNIRAIRRLVELAGPANTNWSWCFFGAAGRRELLTAVEPEIVLICRDPHDVPRGCIALERLRKDLAACGYISHSKADREPLCATLASWQDRFGRWVRDPIRTHMYAGRPLFDLRPAFGDEDLWQSLEISVCNAIRAEPSFQKLLANDCLSALPPLTFFEDAVVEESGERSEIFALEQRALGPMVDVGRVFGMVNGKVLGCSTLDRLMLARSRMPGSESLFREAAETFRVLLYLQARTGLRLQSSGSDILASQLSRMDRQALKSGFRAIHNLLQFTVNHLWTEAS